MTDFSAEQFDLLVIGGGITGCGVARDAAMRGLSVVLVERDDFASGTSGRSSRLIHGGIRYLEQRQFHLVYESIRERQILLRIAPHLVEPLAFTWPIYRGARVGKLKLGAALFIYELMAGRRASRHESLDAAETLAREPGLESAELAGGAVYYDARTDDSRLTVANAVAAAHAGATVLTHTSVTEVLRAAGKSIGALTRAQFSGEQREIRARVIVNSTGVWQNSFNDGSGGRRHRGSKGTHISIPRERIANRDALTLISPVDGRVMFCLPAGTQTIIGTTDTWTDESPESVHASSSEVDYLLNAANHYFPRANLTSDDVTSAWAGIRPLAFASTTHPSRASREHSIVSDRSGVIHVTGGKLTTYRSMAAEVVDRAQNALGRRKQRAPTDAVELPGADRSDEIAKLQRDDPALSQPLAKGLQYTAAHLVYAVRNEMAQTLSDLLIRRTHLAFETRDHGKSAAPVAADVVGPLLGWSEQTKATRIREFDEDTERMFSIGN